MIGSSKRYPSLCFVLRNVHFVESAYREGSIINKYLGLLLFPVLTQPNGPDSACKIKWRMIFLWNKAKYLDRIDIHI